MAILVSFIAVVLTAIYFEIVPGDGLVKMTIFLVVGFIYIVMKSKYNKIGIKDLEKRLGALKDGNLSSKSSKKKARKDLVLIQENIDVLRKNLMTNNFETQVVSSQITAVSQNIALSMESSLLANKELSSKADEMTTLNKESNDRINKAVDDVKDSSG